MSLRRGLMWFVGLTIFVGILVIHYTSDSETWRLLMQARYLGVALALILAALGWVFDALRIQVIAEIMEERVPFKTEMCIRDRREARYCFAVMGAPLRMLSIWQPN